MKKNDLILIVSVLLYSYLFYAQGAGINFLLFTICLLAGLLIKETELLKSRAWIATAIASILSSICVFLYGNNLSVLSNILSLSLTAAFALSRNSSLIFSIAFSAFSYLSSIFYIIKDFVERKRAAETETAYAKLLITIVPLLISVIFFFIYREANPIFKNFTEGFNFDFISWNWIVFTLFGFILLYGFYYPRQIFTLLAIDLAASDNLYKAQFTDENNSGKTLTIIHEKTLGIVLFTMLNILLLTVNILDINYLWISRTLPTGLTHSEMVHQGINMLISSIVISIMIILYYFRGSLNFYENNTTVKVLAYIWILQNAIMILSSGIKNDLYINDYGLTYKRIGVYIYLLLSLIGLATTFIKILKSKNNWFLFRKNGWAFYAVLVISCFFNWDLIIASYNINYSKTLDKYYLLTLSDVAVPQLLDLEKDESKTTASEEYKIYLLHRRNNFIQQYEKAGWQSWNLEDQSIYESLKK